MPDLSKSDAAKQAAEQDLLKLDVKPKTGRKSVMRTRAKRKLGRPKGSGNRRGPGRPKGPVRRPRRSSGIGLVGRLVAKQVKMALKAARAKSSAQIKGLVAREVKKALRFAFR